MTNDSDSGRRFIAIPVPDRYEIDCWGNAVKQVVGGEWVRYDDHVASVNLMRSVIEQLEKQAAKLSEELKNAKLEIKVIKLILKGLDR